MEKIRILIIMIVALLAILLYKSFLNFTAILLSANTRAKL